MELLMWSAILSSYLRLRLAVFIADMFHTTADMSSIIFNLCSQFFAIAKIFEWERLNTDIPASNIGHIPTESKAGGFLLYISNKIPYKLWSDLNVYCLKKLESLFIEVLLSNKPSQIFGTIYKHPSINVSTSTNDHLKKCLMQSIMKIKAPFSQVVLT